MRTGQIDRTQLPTAAPIIVRLGETRLEPITITFGATMLSDTLSLIVFAITLLVTSIFPKNFLLAKIPRADTSSCAVFGQVRCPQLTMPAPHSSTASCFLIALCRPAEATSF
jgi:hypothetical protein